MADDKQTLIIRDVPKRIVSLLDNISKSENYASRNQFLVEQLILLAESRSRALYKVLPPIVKEICAEELKDYKKQISDTTNLAARNISLAAVQLLKVTEWFENYIMTDLEPQADEKLTALIDDLSILDDMQEN